MLIMCRRIYQPHFFAWTAPLLARFRAVYGTFIAYLVLVAAVFLSPVNLHGEPWIDTRDAWLRADIERLARAGIVRVPINTWPLMWSGILEDMQQAESAPKAPPVATSFARVMAAGKRARNNFDSATSAKLGVADEPTISRHFGHDRREQTQLSLRHQGMSQHLAYNLEVTKVSDPQDGEKTRYDNSYIGFIWGNWALMLGDIERWWGPAWTSSLILSNNARPTTSVMLQRNYSDPFSLPVLRALGPWTASAFISELDDQRHIYNAKLFGFSLGFKPRPELEINLRRTAQWGGEGRPESFDNFIKLLTGGADNCSYADCKAEEPGNQLGAIDISWHLPIIETTIFGQTLGEDEAGYMPSRSSRQWGLKRHFDALGVSGDLFLEFDNTTTVTYSSHYNILYNHGIYQTGYRYRGRSLGAPWDNDSKITSVGVTGYLANGDGLELRYSSGEINIDSMGAVPSRHSLAVNGGELAALSANWQRRYSWGQLEFGGRYASKLPADVASEFDKFSLNASLRVYFN